MRIDPLTAGRRATSCCIKRGGQGVRVVPSRLNQDGAPLKNSPLLLANQNDWAHQIRRRRSIYIETSLEFDRCRYRCSSKFWQTSLCMYVMALLECVDFENNVDFQRTWTIPIDSDGHFYARIDIVGGRITFL